MSEHPRIQRDATDTGAGEALRRLLVEPTISIPDAARLLGIGRSTVYAAVKSGELPAIRVGSPSAERPRRACPSLAGAVATFRRPQISRPRCAR
ncbi:helix-turn-helix domain-containing protein [Nocardia tengchongensis]|uniref:helix-turn-helix domain-containing protein n=1 Tax=Nocardia tengchongensis TaxID=2055889 RepID=UPI0036920267